MLAKENRLRKKKEFEKVAKEGRGVREEFLVLKYLKNNLNLVRAGFVVSQKISKKAVVRNKVKRRLREIVRRNLEKLKPGYDLIFFTKKGIEEKDFWQIKEVVENLFKKAKLFKNYEEKNTT